LTDNGNDEGEGRITSATNEAIFTDGITTF